MARKEENEAEALRYLDNLFSNITEKGLSYPLVVKEVVIKYGVSRFFVEQSIKFYYLSTNQLVLEENVLRGVNNGVKKNK